MKRRTGIRKQSVEERKLRTRELTGSLTNFHNDTITELHIEQQQ